MDFDETCYKKRRIAETIRLRYSRKKTDCSIYSPSFTNLKKAEISSWSMTIRTLYSFSCGW